MPRFFVSYTISGSASEVIEAVSKEEAESAIDAKINADDFEIDLERVEDVDFYMQELHPVIRDGKHINVTQVRDTDQLANPPYEENHSK